MRRSTVDATQLRHVSDRLGDAVIDPAMWPVVMEEMCRAATASGAILLQSDVRTPDIPRTGAIAELAKVYFEEGWYQQDVRGLRGVPRLLAGDLVFTDQDIFTPEELRREPYYQDFMVPKGFPWFAAIAVYAGSALWALSFQRTASEGPFEAENKRILARLSRRLTETATLSKAVGHAVISGAVNALDLVNQPALAIDRMGFVLDANAQAEQIFDDDLRVCNRRLVLRDQRARFELDRLIDQLRVTPNTAALPTNPFAVLRRAKRPLMIRVLPVPAAASTPFLGARALLILTDLGRKSSPQPSELLHTFGLTPAEAKLATVIATGCSPEQAAEKLGVARETARNQLKAVFAKTGTHRQGELVALLSKL